MGQFFKNIFKFLSYFIALIFLLCFSYIHINDLDEENIPALNFSDSYSFNEKILFLRSKVLNPDIVAIGSSMTQDNLHSQIVVSEMHSDKYINTSSWGMTMQEDFSHLKLLYNIYNFKKLIIVSNVLDFQKSTKRIDYNFIESYLAQNKLGVLRSFLKNFDLNYYFENIKYSKYVRNCKNDYQYLGYDDFGMVRLKKNKFKIIEKRWANNFLDVSLSEIEYSYLDSISQYCKKKDIDFYFLQSPMRQGLYEKLSDIEINSLNNHLDRIRLILENNHNYFVNSNGILWSDTLFIDGIHFNETGALLFTKYCFEKLRNSQTNSNIPIRELGSR